MTYRQERFSSRGRSVGALARGLGWFSIGLGLVELLAPRRLTRSLGMEGQEGLVQAYGLREIATGIGILSANDPAPWIWGRVGGDALDVATLAAGLDENNPKRGNVGLALGAVLGVSALDLVCGQMLTAENRPAPPPRDYSRRSGWPRPVEAMRGAAKDFVVPRDMRVPDALRPYHIPG